MVFNPRGGGVAPNSVGPAELQDNAVTNPKLADDAVGSAEIAAGAVVEAKLGAGAVTSTKLGAGAVVEAALGTGAVTLAKMAAQSKKKTLYSSEYDIVHTGTDIKRFERFKVSKRDIQKIDKIFAAVVARKIDGGGATVGLIKLWLNNDADFDGNDVRVGVSVPTPLLTLTVNSDNDQFLDGSGDLSGVATGNKNIFNVTYETDDATGQVLCDLREFFKEEVD